MLSKGDLFSVYTAYETVAVPNVYGDPNSGSQNHVIVYGAWERGEVPGELNFYIPIADAVAGNSSGDRLIAFDYDSSAPASYRILKWDGTSWVIESSGSAATNGTEFAAAVGFADGSPFTPGAGSQPSFGEFALDITAAGILPSDSSGTCVELSTAGYVFTETGNSATAQLKDFVGAPKIPIRNCAELTLVKEVVNDNGGTAVPGDWTLTATGYDPAHPQTGTYDLSESGGPAGYTQTSLTCDNATGQVTSATLGLNEDVTCTFVNDDDAPSLSLVKEVTNDNGGLAVPGDWTLAAAGYDSASPDAGTYDLSESGGPAGYTQTSLTCDNSTGQVTSVALGLGEDVTCTFVNNDDAPSLTLVKQVTNDNGGLAVPGDWTLTAAGYSAASPQTGPYDLSESGGPAGYTQTSLTCDNSTGQVTSATLAAGEDVVCTFVNDDDAPSLTLVKTVINDNGGTAVAGAWTLAAAGYDSVSPDAGTYALSESGGPAGYTQTSLTCDNAQGQVTSATLALGEDVICTFVNDDAPPGLTLVKTVINDNGGSALPGAWTLAAAAYDSASPDAGTYALSESGGPAGYTQTSLTCDNAQGQVTSATLGLGETVVCTFVNDDDAPSLTLLKIATNDDGGNSVVTDWTLTATGPTGISGITGVSSDATFSAGSYDLSESGPVAYTASDWVCVGGTQDDADTVTLGVGESAVCTITNDDEPVDLKITKNDDGVTAIAGGAPFDYTITVQNIGARDVDLSEPVTVTDELPAGLSWVSFPANCAQAGQTLTCDIDPALLPAGEAPIVITVTVKAGADAVSGTYVNQVSVTTDDDPVCVGVDCVPPPCDQAADNNNVDCEETPVDRQGAIQIVKTDNVADGVAVQPGGTYSYSLVVTNAGASTILPGLVVDDDLPAQLVLVSTVGGAGWTCNGVDPIECTYAPALAPGASAPAITVTVAVVEGASGTSIVNVATVIGAVDRDCVLVQLTEAFVPACNQVTDDDNETTPLNPNADLAIVKTASQDQVGAGGGFNWVLQITNNGPGTAVNVDIGDLVPSTVTVTGVTSSDFTCSNTGNAVTCTRVSLAVGASGTVTIAVTVPATAVGGTVVNVGTVESDTPDPDLTNNSDDALVVIVAQEAPTTTLPPVTLPKTGSDAGGGIMRAAFLLFALGAVTVLVTRRRRDDEFGVIV